MENRSCNIIRLSEVTSTNDYLKELGTGEDSAAHPWLASDKHRVELARQEIETAFWLLTQSVRDAEEACETNPCPQTRALRNAMVTLESVAHFWRNATEAFMLTRVYRIDGAPSTRGARDSLT